MILLVCFFWTLVLMVGARILLYLHRTSRLNPHRVALALSFWVAMIPLVGLVALHPAIDALLFGALLALISFAIAYPLARLVSKQIFETISKSKYTYESRSALSP